MTLISLPTITLQQLDNNLLRVSFHAPLDEGCDITFKVNIRSANMTLMELHDTAISQVIERLLHMKPAASTQG
jgi:hypothetical protein